MSLKQRPDVVVGHNVPVRKVPDEEFYHIEFLLQFANLKEVNILLSEIKRLQLTLQKQGPTEASSHKIISTVLFLILWIVS